jgi:hypothetical protein
MKNFKVVKCNMMMPVIFMKSCKVEKQEYIFILARVGIKLDPSD